MGLNVRVRVGLRLDGQVLRLRRQLGLGGGVGLGLRLQLLGVVGVHRGPRVLGVGAGGRRFQQVGVRRHCGRRVRVLRRLGR